MKLLVIDNYDSFTFNLVQYLGELGANSDVVRNDRITPAEAGERGAEAIVISPGPCTPNEAGISMEVARRYAGSLPILGVCLGHQSIAQAFGGRIVPARQLMHGKVSRVSHDQRGLFAGLPQEANRPCSRLLTVPPSRPSCASWPGIATGCCTNTSTTRGGRTSASAGSTAPPAANLRSSTSKCARPRMPAPISPTPRRALAPSARADAGTANTPAAVTAAPAVVLMNSRRETLSWSCAMVLTART